MRKLVIIILLFLIFGNMISLSLISGLDIIVSKDSYYPMETLQGEITGNFISFKSDNLLLYKEGVPRSIPSIFELTKQGDKYYFYTSLPNQEGNFSVHIEGAQYILSGETKTETISKGFLINKSEEDALLITPGFVSTNKEFSIKIKSLNSNTNVIAEFESSGEKVNISLIQDVEKTIKFIPIVVGRTNVLISFGNIESGGFFSKLFGAKKSASYIIPIFVYDIKNETPISNDNSKIKTIPESLTATLAIEKNYSFSLLLQNMGETNLTNITLSNNLGLSIEPPNIDFLESGRQRVINVTTQTPESEKETISGDIIIGYGSKNLSIPVLFTLTSKNSEVNLSGTIIEEVVCEDIGTKCDYNQECLGEIRSSLEGDCCVGECIEKTKSKVGLVIGILIILLVLGLALLFLFKARKNTTPKSTEEILRNKSKRYEERVEGKEVTRSLGKI